MQTTAKKKITSSFSFPSEINMSQRLSDSSQSELIYDLSAVLIHKGSAVNSGHYIAHIKDETTEQWWEFDDEQVSNLGLQPFGGNCSNSAAKPSLTGSAGLSSSDQKNDVNQILTEKAQEQFPDSSTSSHAKTFSSSDAYMLMYVLRHSKNDNAYSQQFDSPLPLHLQEEVEQLNATYLDSCKQYKSKTGFELNRVMERRQEVRSILSEAPVHSLDGQYYWISADWLRQWADSIVSP